MTYTAPTAYRRTDAELADPALSWARPDRAFFAAGACHILAWAFLEAHPHPGTDRGRDLDRDPDRDQAFRTLGLRRVGESHAFHTIATDGVVAFDYAGWTDRAELLTVIEAAVAAERPETTGAAERPGTTGGAERLEAAVETVELPGDLAGFCAAHHHRLPEQFLGDVWARARAYLRSLGVTPACAPPAVPLAGRAPAAPRPPRSSA